MPQLRAIHAITYSSAPTSGGSGGAGDLSSRIAPPYDVLDEGPKQALLAEDPHNIVAVDLPVTPPKTVGPDSAYAQAGDTLRRWLNEGVLVGDDQPAIFAYEQVYSVHGRSLRRRGLFANLVTEPFNRRGGGIFRHEHTIRGGVDDRSKLMDATACQVSPVFGIFSDPHAAVADRLADYFENREPTFTGTTANDGVEHRVWRVADEPIITWLTTFFEQKDVFIADGHHRYTTALNYGEHHRDQPAGGGGGQCLFVLVAREDPGMIVLPTHRVITGLKDFSIDRLLALVDQRDDVTLVPADDGAEHLDDLARSLPNSGRHGMGIYDPASKQTYLLTTTPDPLAATLPDKPEVWRYLDVAILQHLIVEQVLAPAFGGESVQYKYTADLAELTTLAQAGSREESRLGVVMQPTPLQAVCEVALAGEVMPPKSTYFFPKLATGLVINPLD